jgi:hypothetical protein
MVMRKLDCPADRKYWDPPFDTWLISVEQSQFPGLIVGLGLYSEGYALIPVSGKLLYFNPGTILMILEQSRLGRIGRIVEPLAQRSSQRKQILLSCMAFSAL